MLANKTTASIDRRVSWLELFLDLVYVILISKLTHLIIESHTSNVLYDTAVSITLFLIIWQCWITHVLTVNLNESIADATRINTWLHMLGIIWITLIINNANNIIHNYANSFIVAFIFCRLTVFSMYYAVFKKNPHDIDYFKKVAKDALIPIIVFSSSLFFKPPYKYIIWYLSLLFYYLMPLVRGSLVEKVNIRKAHLIERLGGFSIIILGESLWSIAKHSGDYSGTKVYLLLATAELILVFSFFFYYYCVMKKVSREPKLKQGPLLIYLHVLLYIGLILFSAPLAELFNSINYLHVCWCSRMLVAGSAIVFIAIDLIYLTQIKKRYDSNRAIYFRIAFTAIAATTLITLMKYLISIKVLFLLISLIALYVVIITTRRGW